MELDEESEDDEHYFEVDKILDKKQVGKRFQYLVKWVGYSEDQATWEPPTNLSNVKNMLKEFELSYGMASHQNPSTTNTLSNATKDSSQIVEKKSICINQQSKTIGKKRVEATTTTTTGGGLRRGRHFNKKEALEEQQS